MKNARSQNSGTSAAGKRAHFNQLSDLFPESLSRCHGIEGANTCSAKPGQKSTATEAQIQRLIELLRNGPKDTHFLRRMGISHPAGRVQDLLLRGYEVSSSRTTTIDSDGYSHSGVALYDLVDEPDLQFGGGL